MAGGVGTIRAATGPTIAPLLFNKNVLWSNGKGEISVSLPKPGRPALHFGSVVAFAGSCVDAAFLDVDPDAAPAARLAVVAGVEAKGVLVEELEIEKESTSSSSSRNLD